MDSWVPITVCVAVGYVLGRVRPLRREWSRHSEILRTAERLARQAEGLAKQQQKERSGSVFLADRRAAPQAKETP